MSLSLFQTQVFGPKVQTPIVNRGLVPSLYTVPSGTYGFDSSYGSGKPQSHTYVSVVDKNNSKTKIRQHDNEVDFNIQVALDVSGPAPFNIPPIMAPDEVRIKPYPFQPILPNTFSQTLPVPDVDFGLPLFSNVDIVLSNTGAPALAGVVGGVLQARLLYGGQFALVIYDSTNGVTYALTSANLAPLFNSGIPGQQLFIKVRGTYRGQSSM